MIYTSIDIETTGLEPQNHQTLSIAAIIEDTDKKIQFEECPKIHIVLLHKEIHGSPYAISLNMNIIKRISEYNNGNTAKRSEMDNTGIIYCKPEFAIQELYKFFVKNGIGNLEMPKEINGAVSPLKITVAGKNFGTFDKLFLEQLPWWKKLLIVRQRIIDPSVLFVKWDEDETLPSLNECKQRAGIMGDVTHDAMEDAWDVINILRTKY